jgi:hypothetical protein
LTAIYFPGLAVFVRAMREARKFESASGDALAGARRRVLMARQAWEADEYRTAIIDASAAADLAQTVHGPFLDDDRDRRVLLDELRRAAIDPEQAVATGDAVRALEAVSGLLDGALQAGAS